MQQKITKLLVLAFLLVTLSACDSGVPASLPTATNAPSIPGGGTATPGDVAIDPTQEVTEDPAQVSEATIVQPTIDAGSGPPPLPDGPLTLVALGDSLTEGDGDYETDGGGFPVRLERSINNLRPDSQVINLGASGWTSQQMVEGQLPSALEYKPNIATVWIGSNNLWYNNGPENEAQDLDSFAKDIDTTLSSLSGAGARLFVALLDDQTLRPYATANDYSNFTREQLAHMSQLTVKFNDILRAKAAEYNATIVDFYNTTIFTDPATLAEDGIHPNSAGYDIIEKMWFDAIRQAL